MFRKTLLIGTALTFALVILMTSVFRTSAQTTNPSFQVETEEIKIEDGAEEGKVKELLEIKDPVEYSLEWPGLLPDHFLYPIKMVRDKIWLFLTTDSLKKAELLLNFADKRIWAARMLVDKGKLDLGVSIVTKAEKYLERAIDQEKLAKKEGKDTAVFLEKLSRATLKHEEILLLIRKEVTDGAKLTIDEHLNFLLLKHEEMVEKLED